MNIQSWPERWIVDDWADMQVRDFMRSHGQCGRLENVDGYCEWTGPFADFQIDRGLSARGPMTLVLLTPTQEALFDDDLDMSGFESVLELMSPPTRTAVDSGFLLNSTDGLFRIKALHAEGAFCSHPMCV
jgi:hypothetical protein